uniref:Uncharacterized protein n=1 Tax=candidate division CPR3 bacterium TaxID=2268181 RepID=A0A7V3N624_UNCC3
MLKISNLESRYCLEFDVTPPNFSACLQYYAGQACLPCFARRCGQVAMRAGSDCGQVERSADGSKS